jgi:hypothetical protein
VFGPLASRQVFGVEMAYASSISNPRSNQAPTVQKSAKSLKLNKVLRFGQSGCLLERRGGAEAALSTYRQMPRYRRQARREMPSFFILEWSLVRFVPSRGAGEPPNHPLGFLQRPQAMLTPSGFQVGNSSCDLLKTCPGVLRRPSAQET